MSMWCIWQRQPCTSTIATALREPTNTKRLSWATEGLVDQVSFLERRTAW